MIGHSPLFMLATQTAPDGAPGLLLAAVVALAVATTVQINLHWLYERMLESLDDLMRLIGGGVAVLDRDLRVIYYAKSYEEWFGSLEANRGKMCFEAFCHRTVQCPGCPVRRIFEEPGAPVSSIEGEIITVSRERKLVRFIFLPIRSLEGPVEYVLEVAEDLSRRKRAERQVVELTELNRQIVENASVGIFAVNPGHEVTRWNRYMERQYDVPAEDVLGRRIEEVFPAVVEEGLLEKIDDVLRFGGTVTTEIRHQTRKRGAREIVVTILPVHSSDDRVAGAVIFVDDMTDLRQMTKTIASQKAFLESLIENANVLMVAMDHDGTVRLWNRSAEAVLGYSREEIIGKPELIDRAFPDPAYREEFLAMVMNPPVRLEANTRTRGGEDRIISWSVIATTGGYGAEPGCFAVGVDVTDRKKLEEEIIRERERLYSILNNMDESVVLETPDHEVLFMNRRAVETFGEVDRSFLLEARSETASLFQAGIVNHETLLVQEAQARNGRWYEISSKPIQLMGGVQAFVKTARDVTDRKAAEREFRRTAKLTQTVTDAIVATDTDLTITLWNPGAERLTGYASAEAVGRNISIISPTGRPREDVEDIKRIVIERGGFQAERTLRRKNGEIFDVLFSASPIRDQRGNVESFVFFAKDLTDFKEVQQQLFHAQKMESIGKLAGGIAHDFNNILSGILGHASFMKEAVPEGSDLYPDIERIEASARRAASLTRQLLGFARGGRYQPQLIDVNELANETLDMLARTFAKGIVVRRELEADLWAVEADRIQIQQVLMNLCINGSEAMPEGGALCVATRNVQLTRLQAAHLSPLAEAGKYVEIAVVDTGVGMDNETQQHIFEPFYSTKGSSGLGLSMVYGIVRNHKGFITFESELGRGSTFRVHIPAQEARPAKEAAPEEEEVVTGRGTVLVADDEETVREVLTRMLQKLGYRVLAAADGAATLAIYEQHKGEIDLVLLDMIMPGITGKEVFDRLRAIDPGVRVLLSSGFVQTDAAVEAQRQGALGFLEKPYDFAVLSRVVREALEKEQRRT